MKHQTFGPPAIRLARFIRIHRRMDLFDLLDLVDEHFPKLSFHDWHGAVVLAEALCEAEGRS
jgi:hypothetical protein